eukprot:m.99851 g.99851  ORF g.99851 m.99851 type:complete len:263 (+) comp13685_c0_seq2:217-1005(+)
MNVHHSIHSALGSCNHRSGWGLDHDIVTCLEDCDIRRRNRKLKDENLKLQEQVQELNRKLQESKSAQKKAEDASEVGELKAKLQRQQEDMEASNERIKKLMEMQDLLSKKHEEHLKEIKQKTQHISDLEKSRDGLQSQISKLTYLVQTYEAKMKEHKRKIEQHNINVKHEHEKKIKNLDKKIGKLKEVNQDLLDKYLKLKQNAKLANSELEFLDDEFFEEIEDLKFALHRANRLNILMDDALRKAADYCQVPYENLMPPGFN